MADTEKENKKAKKASKGTSKKARAKAEADQSADAAAEGVEFQAESKGLDFEEKETPFSRVSKLAALARAVAEAVAERDARIEEPELGAITTEQAEAAKADAAHVGEAAPAEMEAEAASADAAEMPIEEEGEEASMEAAESAMQPSEQALEDLTNEDPEMIAAREQEAEAMAELQAVDEEILPEMTAQAEIEGATAEIKAEILAHDTHAGVSEEAVGEENPELNLDAAAPEVDANMEQMGFSALEEELEAAENDADPEPTEFIENDQLISIIESMLFSTDKPVSTATIKALFKGTNIRTKDITRALDILASEYASATRGVTLEEINGGYQLRTKVDNAEFLKRLQKVRPFRLSGPALETMAIVAYKQPVTKHEVDEIRGVESGHLLRALMERGLVNFQGKAEHLPGKPMAYGTTRKFLETFGLRNIRELPTLSEIDDLLPEGIGEVEQEKEKLSDLTGKLSTEFTGGYSEGEDELLKINETLQAIDTTSEFFEQEKVRERERRDRERAQDIREKIVLGDEVEEKDRRWLDRYEAKLAAIEAGVQPPMDTTEEAVASTGGQMLAAEGMSGNAEIEIVPAEQMAAEHDESFGEKLEGLTQEADASRAANEAQDDEEVDAIDEALMASEENEDDIDNLSGDLEWNEDVESDKNT